MSNNNILSTPVSIEGGEPIEDKIENLYHFINRGLFYFGPTWNHSLSWVSSGYDEIHNKKNIKSLGLNKFGIEVIHTCDENGVIIDVSHIGEKSFWDIVEISSKPFIASHSSVHKLCPHFRNLKDDQIIAIKNSGGLIGLNPYPFFIDPTFKKKEEKIRKKLSDQIKQITLKEKDTNVRWIKKQHLLQKELQFINHSILETLEGNGVEVKINIFEGKKFIIEKINIVGNTVTNDSVIRGELLVDEGDPYSALLVNKSINKIKGRRIFSEVTPKTLPGSSEDYKILEITVKEKSTGEIMAGAGIGTDGTTFMFSVTENNWLGKGINLASALNISEEKLSGSIAVTDPNYHFSGNAVSAAFDVSQTDNTGTSGFKSSRTGGSLGASFEQYENIYLSPKIDILHENIETESSASTSIKKMDGDYFNSNFTYGVTIDKRNQSWQPTEGYKASFFQSLPLIQDFSSIANRFNVSKYHDFSENVIGSLKFQLRTIHGVDEDVRLTERQYISPRKLRGFVRGKVGPKDGDDWIGGNYVTGLSAEAALPNLLPESYKTDIGLYLDTGNVWGVDYSDSVDDSNKIRSSVGIAANVFTPIGPLSWTVSQAITKASTDSTETFNFNIGTSF